MNNDIKYHTSLVSKVLIFLPISLYPHKKYQFFVEYQYHLKKYQYNTEYHTFALLFPLVSISSGMGIPVCERFHRILVFFFPGDYPFCEFLESPKEEVAALFVSIVLRVL